MLRGTLRFYVIDDDDPTTLPLDDVPFRFVDTWEPSLIVESSQ